MDFVARLERTSVDPNMLLFQLRRCKADAEFVEPPKGGDDVQVRGSVDDERVDDLLETLKGVPGAVHVGDRHVATGNGLKEHASIEEAEAHLGGPYTAPGTTRATWSYGGNVMDHVVQTLYFADEELDAKALGEATGLRMEQVMRALKDLTGNGTVRRYRREGQRVEAYGLARAERERIDGERTGF